MKRWLKLLGVTLMFVALRFVYTLAQETKMLLTINSFHTSGNLDLFVTQILNKGLPLTYSISILIIISSFLLIATIYYLSESISLNSELGFYATFAYATSVPTYVFLSSTPLIYDSISSIFFVIMLYSLVKMEFQKDKNIINLLTFTASGSIAILLSNALLQNIIFIFLSITILINFHKVVSPIRNRLIIIIYLLVTAYLIIERNSTYLYTTLFSISLFVVPYFLFNNKVGREIVRQIIQHLASVKGNIAVLKKPPVLLLIFVVVVSSIFLSNVNKNTLCIVASLVINFYFFVTGFFLSKDVDKTILFFITLALLVYFVSLSLNYKIPFEYFASYLVLISSPISGAGIQELVENSNIADRYIFTYIISYFLVLMLAIPLLVF